MEVSGQLETPAALPPGKNSSIYWIGDRTGPWDSNVKIHAKGIGYWDIKLIQLARVWG
jgi:hypothetical protein